MKIKLIYIIVGLVVLGVGIYLLTRKSTVLGLGEATNPPKLKIVKGDIQATAN